MNLCVCTCIQLSHKIGFSNICIADILTTTPQDPSPNPTWPCPQREWETLTSGLKGGSSMPAPRRLKFSFLKRGCSFTSRAPPPRHPRRSAGSLQRSYGRAGVVRVPQCGQVGEVPQLQPWSVRPPPCCSTWEQSERACGEKRSEYSSGTSFTSRSTSSRLIFFFLCWKGDWPAIISYRRQPNAHQSGLNVYRSFFTTSGAGQGAQEPELGRWQGMEPSGPRNAQHMILGDQLKYPLTRQATST